MRTEIKSNCVLKLPGQIKIPVRPHLSQFSIFHLPCIRIRVFRASEFPEFSLTALFPDGRLSLTCERYFKANICAVFVVPWIVFFLFLSYLPHRQYPFAGPLKQICVLCLLGRFGPTWRMRDAMCAPPWEAGGLRCG